ncbi:MAG: class I SAM-dependent methyltransferase [Candidatus Dormibacteraeota bacterium]|nr:class I SAM-dependent methyltransferase [Candidatus Dormibacteraeota bacterium]
MPDAAFADPRLAALYDPFDPDRRDLDVYARIVEEFVARSLLDVGCGTGTFACLLARRGIDVVGVDPAGAMLDVARLKPGADRVRWVCGDVRTLPPLAVDMATMTGNVAQVFLTEQDWAATIRCIRDALRVGGLLVFETRDPAREAWRGWTRELTYDRKVIPGVGAVERWDEVTGVAGPLVRFRSTSVFAGGGAVLTSSSTLRFRGREEVERSLRDAGLAVNEVRDAPDRPGREFVFIASRPA